MPIRNKLEDDADTLQSRTSLTTDDVISLLEFVLFNSSFVYNGCFYKQIHGCAMGSPVSPVVANLCMDAIKESPISSTRVPPNIWKRYVDDSFVTVKKDCVSEFHDKLNSIDPMISFATEKRKPNQQISFLDSLVSRNNSFFVLDVFCKLTHTHRYLDFNSQHEKKHKISTASTLLNRACNLPSTIEGKPSKVIHVNSAFFANGYPPTFISKVLKKKKTSPELIPSPEELTGMHVLQFD